MAKTGLLLQRAWKPSASKEAQGRETDRKDYAIRQNIEKSGNLCYQSQEEEEVVSS